MIMPGRFYNAEKYRFGFNGKENDNEVKGVGNQLDYGFRIYDPRIARFLSVDPLFTSYPWFTPYQFAGNGPIWAIDLDGLERLITVRELYADGNIIQDPPIFENGPGSNIALITETRYFVGGSTMDDHGDERLVVLRHFEKVGTVTKNVEAMNLIKVTMIPVNRVEVQLRETPSVTPKLPSKSPSTMSIDPAPLVSSGGVIAPGPIIPSPVPPSSPQINVTPPDPKPEICFICWIGNSDRDWDKGVKNIADWLKDNPDYNLNIKSDGGGSKGEGWTDTESLFGGKSHIQDIQDQFNKFKNYVIKASGGKIDASRLKLSAGKPDGTSLEFKPEIRK